tara:strand:- start:29325 stop:30062 length:738 start_codon:yes stop_codon:yes gene_type:complete
MSRAPGNSPQRPAITSRLQRALSIVPVDAAAVPSGELLAWLGQPLDLHSASELADVLSTQGTRKEPVEPVPGQGGAADASDSCEETLLAVQRGVLRELARSFACAEGALLPLPRFDAPSALDGLSAAERLRRFHAAWQREMELRIQALRRDLRARLRRVSPELAGLAALDEALERHVLRAGEAALVNVPPLLVPRWEALLADHADAVSQELLVSELRELLLAELEQRLQPALGLVEACTAHGEGN